MSRACSASQLSPSTASASASLLFEGTSSSFISDRLLSRFARESAKKGYPLSDGPHPNGKGGAIAFIDAPEGYEIELIQRGPVA